jgi:phage replication O-like protein O
VAKPDLKNGYLKLAHELFAAVMVAPLPKEARIVLFEVFAQVYGYEKAKAARLSPTDIARRTGMAKPNVARGVAFLLKNGVIRREGMDAYRFVKDYESWGDADGPLIPPRLAGYAACAPDIAGPPRGRNGGRNEPEEDRNSVIETDNPTVDASGFEAKADVDRLSKKGPDVIETDNAVPYRETEKVVVVEGSDEGSDRSLSGSESDNAPTLRIVKPGDPPAIWAQRPFRPSAADVERVKVQVEALDPMAYLGQKVENLKSAYPLDWILKAFTRAAGQAEKIAPFANTLLIAAWQRGYWIDVEDFTKDRPPVTDPMVPASRPTPAAAKKAQQIDALFRRKPDTDRSTA